MKSSYRIGETAKLLGIPTETIRFYELEGLVHPVKDKVNGYRLYALHNIYELLDVIFYRKIGLSIAEIKTLLQDHDKGSMQSFLRQREALVHQKIRQQNLLLQKFSGIINAYSLIESSLDQFTIRPLPSFYILQERNNDLFLGEDGSTLFTTEEFELCTFGGELALRSGVWSKEKEYIWMKRRLAADLGIAEQLQDRPVIESRRGAYTIFTMEDSNSIHEATERLLSFMSHQGYHPADAIRFNCLLTIGTSNSFESYTELFVPVV